MCLFCQKGEDSKSFFSIVTMLKVGLGGKSYQPQEDNALHQFLPQLVEFNRILEKLQTKLEEVKGPCCIQIIWCV